MSETGLRVKLFGRFEAWRGDVPIPSHAWPQRKTHLLFKFLLSERGRFFTQDQLVDALFSDLDPEKAARSLRGRISELRKVLEPDLPRGTDSQFLMHAGLKGYCFSKDTPCSIDTELFEKELALAQRAEEAGRWSEALRGYEQAIAIYQGDYLAEDLYEEWTTAPRERWRELYLKALARLAECYARLRQFSRALGCCQRVLDQAPWHEGIHRQKMLYHYHAGEHTQALQTYQTCTEALKTHLTVQPSPETKKLYEQILKHEVPALPQVFPNNLPRPLTSFIGREREVAEVKSLLATVRLLTLTGVGGCGKTRLALRVAADLLKEYPDGVWWVEWAVLADPVLVPHAVAEALSVKEEPGQALMKSLSDFLRRKNLLLVLDNCEHLLDASAQLTHELLQASPELSILVTSRESLGLAGETVWPVPPLSMPEALSQLQPEILKQYEAVSLFVERARASQPGFRLTPETALSVAQVCQQLEGIPLAIELAAARAKVLSVEQIAARLDDRFRLLTGGSRVVLPRQQTLQATMDWSFQLLSEPERIVLRRLSVFVGGFTLEAAEDVCADEAPTLPSPARAGEGSRTAAPLSCPSGGEVAAGRSGGQTRGLNPLSIEAHAVLDLLTQLVEKSLVIVQPGAQARYRLLETVRQYSSGKLQQSGEESLLRERHLDWFLTLAEQAEPELQGPKQAERLKQLAMDYDNLRAALRWSLAAVGREAGLRLAGALWPFWFVRGYWSEGRQWLERALTQSAGASAVVKAKALSAVGMVTMSQCDFPRARVYYEEVLALQRQLGDQKGIAASLHSLGLVAWQQGNNAAARLLLEESLKIRQELEDQQGLATSLNALGVVAYAEGNYALAGIFFEQALEKFRIVGEKRYVGITLHNLGNVAMQQSDYEKARSLHEQSLVIRQELGDKWGIAYTLLSLGTTAGRQGEYETSHSLIKESLVTRHELGDKRGVALCLEEFAVLAKAQERWERVARLCAASQTLRQSIGAPLVSADRDNHDRMVAAARVGLGEAAFAAVWAEGRAMTLEQAIVYALQ